MPRIAKSIPLPEPHSLSKWPWKYLQVGDSFFMPGDVKKQKNNAATAIYLRGVKFGDTNRYIYGEEKGGVRVWRVR